MIKKNAFTQAIIFGKISFLSLLFLCSACATVNNSHYAEPEQKGDSKHSSAAGLVISGAENTTLASDYFGVIDFTFENQTSDWIRIKNVTLDFGDKATNDAVKIPIGNELIAWARAAEQNKAIKDYNTALLLGSVMAIGLTAASVSNNQGLQATGALAAFGATGGLAVVSVRDEKQKAELAKLVPSTHLMSDDFVVAPGLHAKKWITLYTREPNKIPIIKTVTLIYTLENGHIERAKLKFRDLVSEWQSRE